MDIDFSDKIDNYYANPLCYGHNLYIDGTLIKDLSIPTTVRKLNEYTFHGCSIEFVSIPNTIIDIEENTFLECNQLKKIYLDCPSVKSWFKGLKGIKEFIGVR